MKDRGIIDKGKTFLQRETQVDLTKVKLWNKILAYRRVRNILVHSLGKLEGRKVEDFTNKFLPRLKDDGLIIGQENVLGFDETFCRNFVNDIWEFRREIDQKLDDWWYSQGYRYDNRCDQY